jgi:hypothetical protein
VKKKYKNGPKNRDKSCLSNSYRDASIEKIPAKELRKALLPLHEYCKPIDELIATAEATFEFIRCSELETPTRNAFYRLEKQFNFFKTLVEK